MKAKVQTMLAMLIVLGALAICAIIADSLGALDVYRAQQQTRAAEAQARAYTAQMLVIRERQAFIQTLITALASAKDSLLVTLTYIAGGISLLVAGIIIVVLLLERRVS